MRRTGPLLLASMLVLGGCSNGAVALQTGDGGDDATDGAVPPDTGSRDAGDAMTDGTVPSDTGPALPACSDTLNHGESSFGPFSSGPFVTVVATGAVSYSPTSPTVADVDATLTSVDPTAGTLVLTTDAGDANVTLTQVDSLAALTTGLRVHAHFEQGLVLTDVATGRPLLAALTIEGRGTRSATAAVGPIHFAAGAAECGWVWGSGFGCSEGVERTAVDVTGAARPTADQLVLDGHAYSLRVLQSLRQSDIPGGCAILLYTTFSIVLVAQPG